MMVPLTQGKYAAIDDEDEPKVAGYRWLANRNRADLWYARTEVREGRQRPRYIGMHRLIVDAKPNQIVDHIDGDGLNNRRSNLRIVSHAQNQQNRKVFANRNGFKGVHAATSTSTPWRATITHHGKTIALGHFAEKWQAALAYDIAALKINGEHAAPNFPAELVSEIVKLRALAERVTKLEEALLSIEQTWQRRDLSDADMFHEIRFIVHGALAALKDPA